MLSQLSIQNYALIEHLEIQFTNQFTTITGETGAGKSILLGALGLVLGKRADLSSLNNQEKKCVVEAHFDIKNYNIKSFFLENDLDYEDTTIIRREILSTGKSRAFINDSPVNLNELQNLSALLIDIHSQHQTIEITNELYQIEILDAVAKNDANVFNYKIKLKNYKKIKAEIERLQSEKLNFEKESDYNQFLFDELVQADLIPNEQDFLEQEFEKLSNIEFLKESFQKIALIGNDEEIGLLNLFQECKNILQKTTTYSSKYIEIFERFNSISIELKDLLEDLELQNENLVPNVAEWQKINEKLQLIYQLQKKHAVNTVEELIQIKNNLLVLLDNSFSIDSQLNKLQNDFQNTKDELIILATSISENRKKAAPILAQNMIKIVSKLGMPQAQFNFEIETKQSFLQNGIDQIDFLFSANKGGQFGSLKKVASGGEMSRIMLAIKSILANYTHLPTLIFDEIDTGISGEVAQNMAQIMKEMSENMQIFAITHLPQIATKGNEQFKVYKKSDNQTTLTEIKLLTKEERILEIAEMISGKNPSISAIEHAKNLLN